MSEAALSIVDVKKCYPKTAKNKSEVWALKGVSFEVKPGEIFGLLGPNGAGKTTLISILTTLEKPTSGQVQVFGHNISAQNLQAKKMIGVVPQEIVSSGFLSLRELLHYHAGYFGQTDSEQRNQALLQRLNLAEHQQKMMRQLSGGMKRRMMIAKALVHSPKVLLLDEPTAGVDVELRNQLWDFVRELQREGVSIVLTTHYLQEAEALCDRVGIINKGELKYVGPTRDIIEKLTHKKVEIHLRNGQVHQFSLDHRTEASKQLFGDLFKQQLDQLGMTLSDVTDIKTADGTLEEAFVKVLSI